MDNRFSLAHAAARPLDNRPELIRPVIVTKQNLLQTDTNTNMEFLDRNSPFSYIRRAVITTVNIENNP